jgi:hypothetical protein
VEGRLFRVEKQSIERDWTVVPITLVLLGFQFFYLQVSVQIYLARFLCCSSEFCIPEFLFL